MITAVKPEIRILAIDDGPFSQKAGGKDILVGVVFRGGSFMDGMLKEEIEIDGEDAEEKIIAMIKKTRHYSQLRVIMMDGITFAGLNTVNIKHVYEKTRLPVIVINRKMPDFERFRLALEKIRNAEKRIACIDAAGSIHECTVKVNGKLGKIFYQFCGCSRETAEKIIKISTTHAFMPEPLRIAHLIATGMTLGESVGRA